MSTPLDSSELAHLLVRLEEAVDETGGRFKVQMILVATLFVGMGIAFGVQDSLAVAAFLFAFGGFIVWIGLVAARKNAPEKMRPVLEAMREQPETIRLVHYYETSDTRRVFVTSWLKITTDKNHLLIKAPDHDTLWALLERRCPNAAFTRG